MWLDFLGSPAAVKTAGIFTMALKQFWGVDSNFENRLPEKVRATTDKLITFYFETIFVVCEFSIGQI